MLSVVEQQTIVHDASRTMGTLVVAPRGAGKSRILGRFIAWQDFVRGVPTVLVDPTGGAIANFLDQVMRQLPAVQEQLWQRVRYLDAAARDGYVLPTPILARQGSETLYERSQRFPDLVRRMDAGLSRAPVAGMNAVQYLATATGIVLEALDCEMTEAAHLLTNPKRWQRVWSDSRLQIPETKPVANYLAQGYTELTARERTLRSETLLAKLALFSWDPVSRAMYGASLPGVTWQEVADQRLILLVDLSGLHDVARQQLAMLWQLRSFVEWLRRRGGGHDRQPISFIVDELTAILTPVGADTDLLAADFEEIVARLSRSHQLWLTVAFQELSQVAESVRRTLLQSGTLIFGATSDIETALELAKRFVRYNPNLVKKVVPHYATVHGFVGDLIDETTVEFTIEEQSMLASVQFLQLERYEFLMGMVSHEGSLPTSLQRINLARYDAGRFPDDQLVREAQRQLSERDGRRVTDVLMEIDARLPRLGVVDASVRGSKVHSADAAESEREADDDILTEEPRPRRRIPRGRPVE